MKMKRSVRNFLKLGIIILGYFMGPSPFCKDLSGSCAKVVAMNKIIAKVVLQAMKKMHKYGIKVPRDMRHALELDRQNGNNLWLKP